MNSRWCPTLRRDKKTNDPVLCLNSGDKGSRSERWSPNTEQGDYENVNILLNNGERSVKVWISAVDLSSLNDIQTNELYENSLWIWETISFRKRSLALSSPRKRQNNRGWSRASELYPKEVYRLSAPTIESRHLFLSGLRDLKKAFQSSLILTSVLPHSALIPPIMTILRRDIWTSCSPMPCTTFRSVAHLRMSSINLKGATAKAVYSFLFLFAIWEIYADPCILQAKRCMHATRRQQTKRQRFIQAQVCCANSSCITGPTFV